MKAALSKLLRVIPAIAGVVLGVGAQASMNPSTAVPVMVALNDAHALAAGRDDLKVVRVEGTSMLPYFGDGAVLVVKTLPREKLRPGMVVVYTNRYNETVAHRLLTLNDSGWVAQGYNNNAPDTTLVTAENLIGVVYATFHSDARVSGAVAASALTSTPVALAAAAR